GDVWERVETRAMRQWSGMQFHVAIIEMVDVGVITVRHELKIAEGENGSLGNACGSAGVEQPGLVLGRADRLGDGVGHQQAGIILRLDRDDSGLPRLEDTERSESARHICGAKAGFAAGVGKNERELLLMEPDIHGYGDHAGPPDTVKDL